MKLPPIKNRNWNYLALSFLLPFAMLVFIMLITGCAPFGTSSLMSSDAWHQYFPFFKAFRRAVWNGENLLYTWGGMGMDYLGLYAYYLASPLNLLALIVPESWLLGLFNLLIPTKISLAGMFFALFLKKTFHKDDLSVVLFGGFYALCAWAMGYQWNTMWLDSFALLPLVALGTIQLLEKKKVVLYTVALFFAVWVNYYVGFFVCIFVLLTFICYQICRCRSVGSFFRDFCRIGIFTVLAIGMTAVLEYPALVALGNTQSSVNKFPDYFSVNMVSGDAVTTARTAWSAFKTAREAGESGLFGLWWDAFCSSFPPILEGMKKVAGQMAGGITPNYKEGLPNLHCGVGTVIFSLLFLTAKDVKLRDKLCSVALLVFFALSFILRQLDYIWHGFHFPNMIPYRFSFLFSFVLLYMAYRAFLRREQFKLWQLIVAGILSIGIFLCYEDFTDTVFLAYNLVFFLMYFAALGYAWYASRPLPQNTEETPASCRSQHFHRQAASWALIGVLALELGLNAVNTNIHFPRAAVGSYPRGKADLHAVTEYMQNREDELFYRAEVTHTQTLNDGALVGYDGISAFTSSANVKVTEFMKLLGYAAKNTYNRYAFEEASPVSNLFLNLKYMLEREGNLEENPYFDTVYQSGNCYLLENNVWLPLGFLAESALAELEFVDGNNHFGFQNQLFTAATGIDACVWRVADAAALSINPNNTNLTTQSTTGSCSYKNGGEKTFLDYHYTMADAGFLCLDLTMSARNGYKVLKNGQQLFTEEVGALPHLMGVCQVSPGDEIQIQITCKANESGNIAIKAGVMNEDIFRRGYEILSASTLSLTEFSNTSISGTVQCNREGLLYTSIPQNGSSWSLLVDGKPAQITLVGDVMIAVELTQGQHTLEFVYQNRAFSLGLAVSLACGAVFAATVLFQKVYPQLCYKGKYRKGQK